jgi:hypothetical protein
MSNVRAPFPNRHRGPVRAQAIDAARLCPHLRLYLAPYLGQILLADLSAAHVQAMFTAISRLHAAAGMPVSPATLARVKATLRAALNAAIRPGHITANPASLAELPPARRPRAVVWTRARIEE